jgi:hypothetical protein
VNSVLRLVLSYLNLNYACSYYSLSFHGLFIQICMLVLLGMSDVMFLVNMMCLKKWTVRFYKPDVTIFVVLLTKLDDPVS